MERDGPSPPLDHLVPPPDPTAVYRTGVVGAGLCGAAALAGLGADLAGLDWLNTLRLILVAAGMLTAGAAVSMRAALPGAWLLGAAACGLGWAGLPAHWDSARLLIAVMGVVALAAAGLAALPRTARLSVLSVAILYHFGGIFCATTWPEPTPWPTQQVGTRVYLPYLMFMYLRNAYHFYSPEPGPASLLFCLVKYELDEPETDPKTGKPVLDPDGKPKNKVEYEWLKIPNRGEHLKDPFALTYYRRLSVTEQVAGTIPDYVTPATFEKMDVYVRREKAARGDYSNYPRIPIAPDDVEPRIMQYRMPNPDVSRYLLPSYARHLLKANSRPGREAVTVKVYRIEHRVVRVPEFVAGTSPFHPITHKAYFQGEFYLNTETDRGELLDPQDPMLYWLVPIIPKRQPVLVPAAGSTAADEVEDYLSKHAGYQVEWRRP